uniref:F-box protein At5g07610-like n=1 Tax=Erigeron canadensis TaxID=72917 RepID=UPI001CB9BC9B|nr:F-box protein At5g07610-like [Erigeron canadensis]XP_043634256.1 F-box protein At5g07610-like [Erigeron canadensis]
MMAESENMKRVKVVNESSPAVIVEETIPAGNESFSFYPQAEKVASNQDLLMEILFRLPVRSLLRFKIVSKDWYSIVVSPGFRSKLLSRPKREPPSGLFVPLLRKKIPHLECDFVPFDIENPGKAPFRTPNFDPDVKRIDIEHSSNGLLLCSSKTRDLTNRYGFTHKYYMYNPTTNQSITLPKLENYDNSKRLGMTIAFDPSKSPHYKVVYVCGLGTDRRAGVTGYQIETYSSETRTCKVSYELALDEEIDIYFGAGVYWNNAIHWIHHTGFVLYFNLEKEVVDHVLTPGAHQRVDPESYTSYMYESCDHLLVAQIRNALNTEFNIFESKRDYSSWIVKYRVDIDGLRRPYPEIIFDHNNPRTFCFTLLSIVLGEKDNDDDSFLVLEIGDELKKAVRFNLSSKTSHKLLDFTAFPHSIRSIDFDGIYVHNPNTFQFTESLYNV